MVAVGRLHISANVQHFCAYLALSSLPVIGFRDRQSGIAVAGQHFSPGRALEIGEVMANGVGVSCGVLLAHPSAR